MSLNNPCTLSPRCTQEEHVSALTEVCQSHLSPGHGCNAENCRLPTKRDYNNPKTLKINPKQIAKTKLIFKFKKCGQVYPPQCGHHLRLWFDNYIKEVT